MDKKLRVLSEKALVQKSEAMSVQSIIIGSVIAGIIAAAGLAMLWPAVDAAKVSAEKSTISEVGNAIQGAKAANNGAILELGAATLKKITDRVQSAPTDLDYRVVTVVDGADPANAAQVLHVSAVATAESMTKIKSLFVELDTYYDGTASATAGKFRYDATCTETAAGSGIPNLVDALSDCFYVMHMSSNGITSGDAWWDNDDTLDEVDDASFYGTAAAETVTAGALNN